jgi:hypothetical protein
MKADQVDEIADQVDEILVQFLSFRISAKGGVAISVVAVPLALLLAVIAWRIVSG